MDFSNERNILENGTCNPQIDMDLFLHYSIIPSVLIILALSFLERRINRTRFDDKIQLLDRRFGFVIPLDLIGTFKNRWTFGFAFGAIANKVMSLFSEEYLPPGVPPWAKALGLLVGAIEVGLSYYPIFACLTTNNKIIGSLIGFLYTLIWFIVTMIAIASCPHGEIVGQYEKVIFYWPALLCLIFLIGRFVHIFIKSIRILLGADIRDEETLFLPIHQAEHVKRLFRKPVEVQKTWFESKIYTWDPCFKFPGRMIGTTVLSLFCLYIFVTIEYSAFGIIVELVHSWEAQMEEMAPDISWDAYNNTLASFKEFNSNLVGVWFFTTFLSCAVTVSYIFHILVCYRKHMKRLWIGEKGFLPIKYHNPSPSESVAAIARYTGWQLAYILWGYLILHTVQGMFGMAFVYAFVVPIKRGQALIFLKGLGIAVLTIFIVILLMVLQVVLAGKFFLQNKISPEDKQKPLALNNRKAFHNFNYFFFFYNVILGLSACLFRLFCSLILGTWLIARIDRTILQRGYESADMGYKTWIGMIFVDHYHTNPVLVCFCNILLTTKAEKRLRALTTYCNGSSGPRTSVKARTRWLLFYTLLKNPRLIIQRKLKEMCDTDMDNTMIQSRIIQASLMEVEIRSTQEKPIDLNNVQIRERHLILE
ncbi:stimulated by retinoic acid gene 6 protein-like isoform X1 [Rana temporaria]|uniref:stimulated by retinoic acid gene 6 protein-like isoform X1 n=2 Tax=Rana temporaria TaxID=8407 RepID=UPI001AADC841|nr:stimulated by retinoic acid gene 6 protein-like isoform X1 [Rana temporaria]